MTWNPRNLLKEFGWTEARVATMREMWAAGDSAAEIAKTLGGVTRNAVIGKIHRLGLQRGPICQSATTVANNRIRSRPKKEPKPKKPRVIGVVPDERPVREIEIPSLELVLTANDGGCKYATGYREGEHTFCGNQRVGGRPYCAAHVALTTNTRPPLKPRSRPKPDFAAVAQTRRFG